MINLFLGRASFLFGSVVSNHGKCISPDPISDTLFWKLVSCEGTSKIEHQHQIFLNNSVVFMIDLLGVHSPQCNTRQSTNIFVISAPLDLMLLQCCLSTHASCVPPPRTVHHLGFVLAAILVSFCAPWLFSGMEQRAPSTVQYFGAAARGAIFCCQGQ
jgi:hypothetical protein